MNLHEITPPLPTNPFFVLSEGRCRYNCRRGQIYTPDAYEHHECIRLYAHLEVMYCECDTPPCGNEHAHYIVSGVGVCRPCRNGNHPVPR